MRIELIPETDGAKQLIDGRDERGIRREGRWDRNELESESEKSTFRIGEEYGPNSMNCWNDYSFFEPREGRFPEFMNGLRIPLFRGFLDFTSCHASSPSVAGGKIAVEAF